LMIIFFHIDYHDLQKLSWVLLLVSVLFLIYVLLKGIKINGSRRSFEIMNFVFQPSEMAKYVLIIFLSYFISIKGKRIREFSNGLFPALLIIAFVLIPILLEPDLGTAIIILTIAGIMLFVGGSNLYHLSSISIFSVGAIAFVLANFQYQRARLLTFINTVRGEIDPPWQVLQSLICFANGGLWGLGLGNSKQKLHFLPQPFTDFIFSIISEEAGFIGATIVLSLFIVVLWRGTWIALNAPDKQGMLLAVGITSAITIYAFISVAIAVNLLPITGIPMPFISYGGSSLVMNLMAIGILLNISTQTKRRKRGINITSLSKPRKTKKSKYVSRKYSGRRKVVRRH
ncbi:hypothetical protein GF337_19025, partial [candidate division KSB1 bacterium]|nr:hypothetical protein [candidate division KSB1 bacterium]